VWELVTDAAKSNVLPPREWTDTSAGSADTMLTVRASVVIADTVKSTTGHAAVCNTKKSVVPHLDATTAVYSLPATRPVKVLLAPVARFTEVAPRDTSAGPPDVSVTLTEVVVLLVCVNAIVGHGKVVTCAVTLFPQSFVPRAV